MKSSSVVIKARDTLALAAAPTNFYQFERDMKSFKNELEKRIQYLENIKPKDVKAVFRSDLEAEPLMVILKTFLQQDSAWFASHQDYLSSFMGALVAVEPFEMCCEFLDDGEKETVRTLVNKIENSQNIKKRFTDIAEI